MLIFILLIIHFSRPLLHIQTNLCELNAGMCMAQIDGPWSLNILGNALQHMQLIHEDNHISIQRLMKNPMMSDYNLNANIESAGNCNTFSSTIWTLFLVIESFNIPIVAIKNINFLSICSAWYDTSSSDNLQRIDKVVLCCSIQHIYRVIMVLNIYIFWMLLHILVHYTQKRNWDG